jgi:hypothetical protein
MATDYTDPGYWITKLGGSKGDKQNDFVRLSKETDFADRWP